MTGKTLSHYRVLERIGEGTTGVVYKGEDLALGRAVALKIALKILSPDFSTNTSALLRFQHEARMASTLNHPNICTVHEIAEHEGQQFIVMELLEGQLLSEAIAGRALPLEEVLELAIQISDALDAAHAQGIIHRDLKPTNIFVTRRGQAKILDFGVAQLAPRRSTSRDQSTHIPSTGGTVPYRSPEQLRGEELDQRSDLFSLGVVLYEMTTGRRAFIGQSPEEIGHAISTQVPIPPRTLNPDLPAEMDRIVCKALEKNRKLRFQTASDLQADLQRLKRDVEVMRTSAMTIGGRTTDEKRLPSWAVAVGGGVSFGVLLLAAWITVRQRDMDAPSTVGATIAPASAGARADTQSVAAAQPELGAKPKVASTTGRPEDSDADRLAAQQELRIARSKSAAGLHDQALATLRSLVVNHRETDEAFEAYFLMGAIQESLKQLDDAMGTYLEIADRYRQHPRAPEALFRLGNLILGSERTGKELQARKVLANLIAQYRQSPWAARALLAKGEIEQRQRLHEVDKILGTSVPSALVSYRQLTRVYPQSPEAPEGLSRLAEIYQDLRRYDLAAKTFGELASRYPNAAGDAWFKAGEIYRRRLRDPARARAAYKRVPAISRHFEDAQGHLK